MTVSRRTLQFLVVGLAIGPVPACITTSVPTPQTELKANDRKSQFAVDRPGMKIPTNPPASLPKPTQNSQTTSQRPNPDKAQEPKAPDPPGGVQIAKATDPNPLPAISTAPPTLVAEPPLSAAVRASIENRPNDALTLLRTLDKPGQEFALAVIPLLLRGSQMNPEKADPNDVAVLAEQFHAVANRLETKAALRIDKITFCKWVNGFGRYDPWPETLPYKTHDRAELYVEVRHVGAEPAAGPNGEGFVTGLVSTLEIHDADGKLIDQTDPTDPRRTVSVAKFERTDFSRTPPRDYFLKYRFPVPSAPGVYTAVVTVKDPVGNRTVRSKATEFRVSGQ